MSAATLPPLAITCGDPAGVGPEIIERWARAHADLARQCVLFGPRALLRRFPGEGVVVGDDEQPISTGHPTIAGARAAMQALESAAQGCAEGRFRGVVTAPISKEWMVRAGFDFPGQTEFFAARWGGSPSMGFAGAHLRVVLATWHIPLAEVPRVLAVEPERVTRAIERAAWMCDALGIARPRIAVCGLNPHAGEAGLLGSEERDWIDPLLDTLRARFPGLSTAQPSDTVFQRAIAGEFDVIVALYHDQGLAPLKTIDFDTAVNVSLGLPHLRTSPDHGTAFGIAGKGIARIDSFAHAVELCLKLTAR